MSARSKTFSEAVRLDPKSANAFYNRGRTHKAKGDLGRAVADFNEAIRLNPEHVAAFGARGLVYRDKGDYDRAIADYSEAIRLDPDDAVARGNALGSKVARVEDAVAGHPFRRGAAMRILASTRSCADRCARRNSGRIRTILSRQARRSQLGDRALEAQFYTWHLRTARWR